VGQGELLVRVVRAGLEESVHLGHVAVCDRRGRLFAFAGDPERPVFARSSMKPLQAAASLAAMGDGGPAGGPAEDEVAVMCASHNGEPVHVETVRRLLARAGLSFDTLRCPPGWPLDPEAMGAAGRARRELHNCSGKHAGKLVGSAGSGWDLESYLDPGHPLQRRITAAVREGTGLPEVQMGVDGCGAPVHGMALARMARLYARLTSPETWDDLGPYVGRATGAMLAEPYLVAGRNRIDTAVMEATGNVIVKAGAEGLLCAAVLEAGVGVAVKVADGSGRADGPVLVEALRQLGLLADSQLERLAAHARPKVLGGGRPVGEVAVAFGLRRS
jgi:L-asparaginase II